MGSTVMANPGFGFYDESTANMQVDPAARPCGGAVESRLVPQPVQRPRT
jgi:hypothetical protein